jgi:hypothetical protein
LNTGKTDHGSKALTVNGKQLEADLVRMDRYLSHKTRFSERITYSDCPRISRSEVYRFIEQEGRAMATSVSEDPKKDEKRRMNYERRVDLTNAAEFIFQFFLPSEFEGPTVLEYWGAIHRILVVSRSHDASVLANVMNRRPLVLNLEINQSTRRRGEEYKNPGSVKEILRTFSNTLNQWSETSNHSRI